MSQELEILIDWVGVTLHNVDPKDLIDCMLLDYTKFISHKPHQRGYNQGLWWNYISIAFDGVKDNKNTIHLSMSGQGCREFESNQMLSWEGLFRIIDSISEKAKYTRLDLAIDDKRKTSRDTFEIKTLYRKSKRTETRSKWKTAELKEKYNLHDGEVIKNVLEFGSRSSEIYCRFYDKRLERLDKLKHLSPELMAKEIDKLPSRWVRCELEMKDNKATLVAQKIANNEPCGEIALGTLKYYLTFLKPNKSDSNKSRWEVWRPWSNFLAYIEPLQLKIIKTEISLEKKKYYMEKQWGKTMMKLIIGDENDSSLQMIAFNSRHKLTPKDYLEIEKYQEDKEKEKFSRPKSQRELKK